MPIDPICKMKVDESTPFKAELGGRMYYFCALACKKTFDQNPAKYAEVSPEAAHSGHHM